MPDYRRMFVPGGEYFFTVNLEDRKSDALVRRIDALRAAWRYVEARAPFETVAAVVLPDHLHCIWLLPSGDDDFPTRWRLLKAHFTRSLAKARATPDGRRLGERGLWQRRFWEHVIRDDRDRQRHVDYIHNNPVKHGYCSRVDEWPHSTWRRWDAMTTNDPVAPGYVRGSSRDL
jgi:putative transposase